MTVVLISKGRWHLLWVCEVIAAFVCLLCFRCDCTGWVALCHTFCSWSASEWQLLGISMWQQAIRTTAWRDKHRSEKIKIQVVSFNVLIAILSSSTQRWWLLIWVIQWVDESVQLSHIVARPEVHRFVKSPRSYLQILGTERVTCSKFYAEDPQILVATLQNLFVVATATWRPGFVHAWTRARGGRPRIRGSVPDRDTAYLVSYISSRLARKPTGPLNRWNFHIRFSIHFRGMVLN